MDTLAAFKHGDGAHCGLTDWYPEQEQALVAALASREAFDTGWYGSKKEIASARIWSSDGVRIEVEVGVSDDFDTDGRGYADTKEWTIDAVQSCVAKAWDKAEADRADNEPYVGFSVHDVNGSWIETYLVSIDDFDVPPGDNYYWWGWQHDEIDDEGIPDPRIPADTAQKLAEWAHRWAYAQEGNNSLTIGSWTIKPWRDEPPGYEDPNDYRGMGWVGSDGRP